MTGHTRELGLGAASRRHPWTFFALAIAIPWALWLGAGALSHVSGSTGATRAGVTLLALGGLCAPVAIGGWLTLRDPVLAKDARRRLGVTGLRSRYGLVALLCMPVSLLVATLLSLPLGYPASQFELKGAWSVMVGTVPGWLTLGLAAVLEELAWHGYGTDALVERWSLWRTTWVFSIFWILWHVPLATIQGSYQAEVVDVGPLASANFVVSIVPFMIIMNWLYYRAERNIWVPVILHTAANYGNEILRTHPDTKVIQTALLLVICVGILWVDREMFFSRRSRHVTASAAPVA